MSQRHLKAVPPPVDPERGQAMIAACGSLYNLMPFEVHSESGLYASRAYQRLRGYTEDVRRTEDYYGD